MANSEVCREVCEETLHIVGVFDVFLKKQKIEHVFTNRANLNKAAFAELAIKHIKAILGRSLAENRANVMGKVLSAVYSMNNTIHSQTRPLGVSPSDLLTPPNKRTRPNAPLDTCKSLIDATILHYRRYQNNRNQNAIVNGQRQKFRVGNRVRIAIENGNRFAKISDPQWSSDSYSVVEVVPTFPLLSYRLAFTTPDRVRVSLPGSFSEIKLKLDKSLQ